MSLEKTFRDTIRNEIEVQLKPLRAVISRLEAGTADLDALRDVVERLAPVAQAMAPLFGAQVGRPAKRGPGRPAKVAAPAPAAGGGKRRGRKPAGGEGGRDCAIIGCGSPSRTKGYCAAHYQKLRMLTKTNRRPTAWKDYAEPNSVEDIKLPRGRAASKALAEAAAGGSST